MKFGKLICDARDLSTQDWRTKWMDYKALKKILKAISPKPASVGPDELANQLGEFSCLASHVVGN
jgi:SPX domain protein involved in polyphosphate accumulation